MNCEMITYYDLKAGSNLADVRHSPNHLVFTIITEGIKYINSKEIKTIPS